MRKIVGKLYALIRKPIVMSTESILVMLMAAMLVGIKAIGIAKWAIITVAVLGLLDIVVIILASVFDKREV